MIVSAHQSLEMDTFFVFFFFKILERHLDFIYLTLFMYLRLREESKEGKGKVGCFEDVLFGLYWKISFVAKFHG